jgi:transcriptional regulator with XRE-family HTH domain
MTLEDVSKKTGLSKSFLSQVERGITEPSITSLKKVAKEYGYSVVNLFQEGNEVNSDWVYQGHIQKQSETHPTYVERPEVVRADRRKKLCLPGSNVMYDLLTPDLNRQIEVMYMTVSKGDTSGDEPMLDPPGEKMGIVLRGVLEVRIGTERYRLEEGDSIYYPTTMPHSWRAVEGKVIEVIWILTPPSF